MAALTREERAFLDQLAAVIANAYFYRGSRTAPADRSARLVERDGRVLIAVFDVDKGETEREAFSFEVLPWLL